MRVWIDQDLCTGDGLCVDHCPDVFVQLEDGIAYVREGGLTLNDPGGSGSLAAVPFRRIQDAVHAAEACPGECIFIEIDTAGDSDLDVDVDGRIAARIDVRPDAA
ncbi:MAG: ferredoxin [Actinomycetota bacterium]|nr:ferredoxin [Actinomycetota bacterium]